MYIMLLSGLAELLKNRNQWLLVVFATYVGFILIFSVVYYVIYRRYPRAFAFNADVLRSQSETFKADTEKAILKILNELDILKHLIEQLQNRENRVPFEAQLLEEGVVVTPQYKCHITLVTVRAAGPVATPNVQRFTDLRVEDTDENRVVKIRRDEHIKNFSDNLRSYRGAIQLFSDDLEKALKEHRRRLSTLSGDSPEVWTYLDFLYFSTITQTTVGYGDILPNSTRVRVIVILQILVGLLIVGFVINYVVS